MSAAPLLDYIEAAKRKASVLAQVGENSGDWMGLAIAALRSILHSLPEEFPAELIRVSITPMVGKPHSPNAWGAFTKRAVRLRLIEETAGGLRCVELSPTGGARQLIGFVRHDSNFGHPRRY